MTPSGDAGYDVLDARTYPTNSNGDDVVPDFERGCDHLKPNNTYFRSEVAPGGDRPVFVELDPYLPFLEKRFRGYRQFDGVSYELAIAGKPDRVGGMTDTKPAGEVWRHIDRLSGSADAGHAAAVPQYSAEDLMQFIGKRHYEEPDNFVEEVRQMGLSKGVNIPNSIDKMPKIVPGVTRLWLIHPNAILREVETGETDDDGEPIVDTETTPGVIGYVYLTRIAHTRTEEGEVPEWVREAADAGRLDIIDIGDTVSMDDDQHPAQSGVDYSDDGQATLDGAMDDDADAEPPEWFIFEREGAKDHAVSADTWADAADGGDDATALCNRASVPADAEVVPARSVDDMDGFDMCGNCSSLLADHLTDGPVECEWCDREFDSDRALRSHAGKCPEKPADGGD